MKISELDPLLTGFSPAVDVFALVHAGKTSKVTPADIIGDYLLNTTTIRIGNLVVSGSISFASLLMTTQPVDTNNTTGATTAFVLGQASAVAPLMDGAAAVIGTATRFARSDHVHPVDTTRAPTASPLLSGEVMMPGGAVASSAVPDTSLDISFLTSLPAGVTFTRSTGNASYIDINGVMQIAGVNVPRFEYDIVTHAPRGMLIEEARTNSLTNSDTGNPGSGAVASTAVPALRSAATIWQHTWPAGVANGPIFGLNMPVVAGTTYVGSVWVYVPSSYSLAVDGLIRLDMDIGALGTGGTSVSGVVDPSKRDRWQRIVSIVTLGTGSGSTMNMLLRRATPTTGGSVYYSTCPQFEVGGFATSHIPTAGTAVTRQVDLVTMPLGSWFNQSAGTLAIEFQPTQPISTAALFYEMLMVDTGANTDAMGLRLLGAGGLMRIEAWVANVFTNDIVVANPVTLGINRAAFTYNRVSGLSMSGAVNAGAVVSGVPTNLPTALTRATIGGGRGAPANVYFRRMRCWPRPLAGAEVQAAGMPTQLAGVALDNASIGETTPANGTFLRVKTGSITGPTWTTGTALPSTAEPVGSLYSRVGGVVGGTLYVSRGGGSWNAVAGV
jgi:hypothetical protein